MLLKLSLNYPGRTPCCRFKRKLPPCLNCPLRIPRVFYSNSFDKTAFINAYFFTFSLTRRVKISAVLRRSTTFNKGRGLFLLKLFNLDC